jgi:HD superfamily phosphodiesterase
MSSKLEQLEYEARKAFEQYDAVDARNRLAASELERRWNEKLEEIANSFTGVQQSYAIQAGREVRILVKPEQIDDSAAQLMARDIAKRIESELSFPGQIRVTVVRETRAVEYAK